MAKNRDLWLYDVADGLRTQFTFDSGEKPYPIWSADGTQIVFAVNRSGRQRHRFLVNTRMGDAMPAPITLVVNWTVLLKP